MFEFLAGALFLGVPVGAWGYRYYLKKDPDRLERWAQAVKRARDVSQAIADRKRAGK